MTSGEATTSLRLANHLGSSGGADVTFSAARAAPARPGEAIAAMIAGTRPPFDAAPFTPGRYL